MVTDRHSLSVFDIEGAQLSMRQVDESGSEIDRFVVTKAAKHMPAAIEHRD
jgi:hypothetical protein